MIMNEFFIAAGSVAGVFTGMAIDRVSQVSSKGRLYEEIPSADYRRAALERRIVSEAMKRVYDYEGMGKISSAEREKLLARYGQQVDAFNARDVSLHNNAPDLNAFKTDLIALVDQRMSRIHARFDALASMINGNLVQKPVVSDLEKKEEKPVVHKKVQPAQTVENIETTESDASLDDIKKQIMQTLSRLEQAEVE